MSSVALNAHHLNQNLFGVLKSLEQGGVLNLELLLITALQRASLDLLLSVHKGDNAAS